MAFRTERCIPPGGWHDPRYADATLLDSFAIRLPLDAPEDAYRLVRLSLSNPPAPFRSLMTVRDAVMSRLGVKTSRELGTAGGNVDHIEFFPVLSRTPGEVTLGATDHHLDFRTWLTIEREGSARQFVSTTAAIAHNPLGRVYLAIIRPFHVATV